MSAYCHLDWYGYWFSANTWSMVLTDAAHVWSWDKMKVNIFLTKVVWICSTYVRRIIYFFNIKCITKTITFHYFLLSISQNPNLLMDDGECNIYKKYIIKIHWFWLKVVLFLLLLLFAIYCFLEENNKHIIVNGVFFVIYITCINFVLYRKCGHFILPPTKTQPVRWWNIVSVAFQCIKLKTGVR